MRSPWQRLPGSVGYALSMPSPSATQSLDGAVAGDLEARKCLLELVYDDLKAMAGKRMQGERAAHTLQPTALVHEAFLRLIGQDRADWPSRAEFLGLAAEAMRRVLIDHARAKGSAKRGGGWRPTPLDEGQAVGLDDAGGLIALDEALTKLAQSQPRQARVVELCHFGGLTQDEAARVLDVSRDTVKLDWRFARAWLNRELGGPEPTD